MIGKRSWSKAVAMGGAALLLAACGDAPDVAPPGAQADIAAASAERPQRSNRASAAAATLRTLEWDELMPADYQPEKLLEELGVDAMEDDDPRVDAILEELRASWDNAPVVPELEEAYVRLPGFVVPLDGDGSLIYEFLLVPYYGACIHVPPPPANQVVYVMSDEGVPIRQLFDAVWVTGVLTTQRTQSELAAAGYALHASQVVPYE